MNADDAHELQQQALIRGREVWAVIRPHINAAIGGNPNLIERGGSIGEIRGQWVSAQITGVVTVDPAAVARDLARLSYKATFRFESDKWIMEWQISLSYMHYVRRKLAVLWDFVSVAGLLFFIVTFLAWLVGTIYPYYGLDILAARVVDFYSFLYVQGVLTTKTLWEKLSTAYATKAV